MALPELPNPFMLPTSHYKRDFDIIEGAINDNARYLQLMTQAPFEQCAVWVREQFRATGQFPLVDPSTFVLDKNQYGDRSKKTTTFMGFIKRVEKQNLLLSPSLTAYMPESQRQSTHAIYIKEGVANRKRVKGEQMAAERAKDFELAQVRKGEQENFKINNNSYSGATVSAATILYYKSTHSSLTSTCRTATSYANANNEKFLMGNRHYYNPEVTKANLVSIINLTDMEKLQIAMDKYGLAYPEPEDVVDMVLYSSKNYWQNRVYTQQIRMMAHGMTPLQRAAVMYVGDLYHLNKLNPVQVRRFLDSISQPGDLNNTITKDEFKQLDGDTRLLTYFLCFEEVKGRSDELLLKENPEVFDLLYATGKGVVDGLDEHKELINALFLTRNIPHSIHAFKDSYRRAAVISDTDSTMFTMQFWVEEFYGRVCFTAEAKRTVFGLVFLVSEVVMHILAIQSANMGVAEDKLRLLAMKNEYYFAVLSLTTRSKHYFASQDAVEGIMFEIARMEVKGVGLRDSKVQPRINKKGKQLMAHIIDCVKTETPIDLATILKDIADLEREIYISVRTGKADYLTTGQCKSSNAYKSEEDNDTYKKYLFWRDIFSPSYGEIPPPPYSFYKISLTAHNRTGMNEWFDSLEDKRLAMRLKEWALANKKTSLTSINVPSSVVENMGVPESITRVADVRTVISNTMGIFYLILESLGIFLIDGNNTRLISDYY
uniref:DNA polymerase n=1 Tax=Pseudomonas phage RVTF4 TaxID=3236931 RepID=A0AB39CCH1_9VIRU